MIFPDLKNKTFGSVNLNLEAEKWFEQNFFSTKRNPLLDPHICQDFVDEVHKKHGLDFSYGGWMENRSTLWARSYLEKNKSFIHLGVDLNVPSGTRIALDFPGQVVLVDDDFPEEGGWGPRVIVKHGTLPVYVIYAHLDGIDCKVGDDLKNNDVFAQVGMFPKNGNWFPHLHVQLVANEYYEMLVKENILSTLDGYAHEEEIEELAEKFPDPMRLIFLS